MDHDPSPLPTGYYLDSFERLVNAVLERYPDLLYADERATVTRFQGLPLAERRLYVRMFMRKGPWFRMDQLDYPEIGDPEPILDHLCMAGFCDREAAPLDLIGLMTRKDLRAWLMARGEEVPGSLDRSALQARCLGRLQGEDGAGSHEALMAWLRPARPLQRALWALFCFLFFGHPEEDLSRFILSDLGRTRYEHYEVDQAHRLFETRRDVDFLISLKAYRDRLEGLAGDPEGLATLTEEVLSMEPHPGVRQQSRYQRLLVHLGHAWEKEGGLERACRCYEKSPCPAARERLVRLAVDPVQACRMAMQIGEAPMEVGEAAFARRFLNRWRKRNPEAEAWLATHPVDEVVPTIQVVLPRQESVEAAVLYALRADGWEGFHGENDLWRALFALVFWEAFFAPIPGAFQHPFQSAPMDLHHPGFYARRADVIDRCLARIQSRDALLRQVQGTIEAKRGMAHAFLSWKHLREDMLQVCMERVPIPVLTAVMQRMIQRPSAFTHGFPDLFVYCLKNEDWALREVKGPGDVLRPEQREWLKVFRAHGCDACVVSVGWKV